MKKTLLHTSLLSILCILSSGCSNHIRSAVPINIANPGYEAERVAIAVDYFGVKHIARAECPIGTTTGCKLIYSRAISGSVTDMWTWLPAVGYSGVDEIAIAVTDNGTAVLAWNTDKSPGNVHTTMYMVTSAPGTVQELMPGYVSSGTPLLVSRFNVIYAVNLLYNGSYIALRYRQMLGGTALGWISDIGLPYHCYSPSAAVSPSGWLHAAYLCGTGPDIIYADNHSNTGDMTNRFTILSGATNYSPPVIDVYGSPETVHMAYHVDVYTTGYNDALFVSNCPAAGCNSLSDIGFEYPLDPSKHWDICSGKIEIVADAGTNAYFAFYGKNDDTAGDFEIFEGYTTNGISQGVYNISNLTGYDSGPTIGLTSSYIPVTVWQHQSGVFYEFETWPLFYYSNQRKIYTTINGIAAMSAQNDLSCNADWAAGIWIEDKTADQAYILFNVYPAFLPMIKK